MTIEKNENHAKIVSLLESASEALRKAAILAGDDSYHWEGPAYGMGGWITSGEWEASSQSC